MAYRVTTYQQAFEGELGIKINDEIRKFLARMEKDGHNLVAKIKELAVKFNVMNEKPIALEGSP